tara:strand:- start:41 stop:571 length:531 start_codon:yes stop_codon:yes gene_type:complete
MSIKIKSARLSFPSIFNTATFGGEDTGKFEATFILDKKDHADVIKEIQTEIARLQKDELKGKIPADKICLKDGDESDRAEFAGKYTIKASTKKRPLVINRDKTPIVEQDNVIYAGCYVNGIISLWAQNNQYGKRINGQLDGVQFVRDGEPFSDNSVGVDAFDAFGDDDDTDTAFLN